MPTPSRHSESSATTRAVNTRKRVGTPGPIGAAKFETEKTVTRPQDAKEGDVDARLVADAKCDVAGIEVPVRERQASDVASREADAAFEPGIGGRAGVNGKHSFMSRDHKQP